MQPLILQYLMSDDLGAGDATLVEGRKGKVAPEAEVEGEAIKPAAEEGGQVRSQGLCRTARARPTRTYSSDAVEERERSERVRRRNCENQFASFPDGVRVCQEHGA